MNEQEKRQVERLFGWVLFGLGVIYVIQVCGQLILAIIHHTAGWWEWTLAIVAEVGVISTFMSPALWRSKIISSKQHNYWTEINIGLWIVWILASTAWVYCT